MREDLKNRCIIVKIINFNELRIFESALGQHNAITIIRKSDDYGAIASCCISNLNGFATNEILNEVLFKRNNMTEYIDIKNEDLYDKNGKINFYNNSDPIIKKMKNKGNYFISDSEIGNGIDILQESVTDRHISKYPDLIKGAGVFALSESEVAELNLSDHEKEILKPYYTSSELKQFRIVNKNIKWIIYSNKEVVNNIEKYPNIKAHLEKYERIITSDNKPYGLHRAREEKIFLGEKLLSLRMTDKPCFTYSNGPCYVTRAHLVIKLNSTNEKLYKYLLGILNSTLCNYWLYHQGKRKGNQLQIDKEPIKNIPIHVSEKHYNEMTSLVDQILKTKEDITNIKSRIDALVYRIYGLEPVEIDRIKKFQGSHVHLKDFCLG